MFTRDRGPVNFVTTIGIKLDMSNGENAFTHVRNIMAQLPNPTYHLDMAKELDGYKSI